MQPDVTWDGDSQQRFLGRIAAESARLGRLVGDLLDFSLSSRGSCACSGTGATSPWCSTRLSRSCPRPGPR